MVFKWIAAQGKCGLADYRYAGNDVSSPSRRRILRFTLYCGLADDAVARRRNTYTVGVHRPRHGLFCITPRSRHIESRPARHAAAAMCLPLLRRMQFAEFTLRLSTWLRRGLYSMRAYGFFACSQISRGDILRFRRCAVRFRCLTAPAAALR